jgi:ABC-type multidrug transport system fused ATPase/permease subunit
MSANKAGKRSEGDDEVDSNSIAVLEPKVEIPLVDSTATLLTQSEKQTAAEMDAPRPIDGEDVDGSKDRAATGRAERSMKQDFKRIIQESKGQTNRLMLGIFFLILTALCSMFLPYFAGKMTDAVTIAMTGDSARAKRKATEAFYGILLVSLLGGVFQSARSYLFNTASYKVVARLRNRLFSNILKQEIGFFDTVTSGSLISRLTADTNLLKNVATQNLSMFLRGLATAVIGLAFMFLTSYRLTLVVIAAFPPLIFVAMWQGRRLRNLSKETQAALAEATAVAEDSLGAIRTVRGFAREVGEAEHFAMSVDKALGVEMKYGLGHALFNGAMMAAATAVLGATFWYGSLLAIEGDMTIGQLNAFILYSINSSAGLFLISATFVSVIQALGASTRVFELMDRTSRIPMDGKDKPGDESEHGVAVALTDVHFAYPSNPERGILRGLNLDVPAGHTVAIVGPSGAGKSTIASLVMRFYEPSGGVVTIGGVPVANIDHVHLHAVVGIVSQEPVLFARSIGANARFGAPDATEDEVWRALERANVADFVRGLDNGLDTWVGERGIKLSGGQKQRIAIARAIIVNPKALLLDEATSALDAESERLVNASLDDVMKGRTSIVIAHRLSTIQGADKVAVLDGGVVAEQGTHEELMNPKSAKGVYANLMRRQLMGLGASTEHLDET